MMSRLKKMTSTSSKPPMVEVPAEPLELLEPPEQLQDADAQVLAQAYQRLETVDSEQL